MYYIIKNQLCKDIRKYLLACTNKLMNNHLCFYILQKGFNELYQLENYEGLLTKQAVLCYMYYSLIVKLAQVTDKIHAVKIVLTQHFVHGNSHRIG